MAPPAPLPDTALRRSSQAGMKRYNERLVLSLLRLHGPLPRAAIARQSGLSAQACSSIMGSLEAAGLITRGERLRRGVGQPSIPMRLNPDGAFSLGVKIGRRTAEITLMDMIGARRVTVRRAYRYPEPEAIGAFLAEGSRAVIATLPAALHGRLCGTGIAAPSELWSWHQEVGIPAEVARAWRAHDLQEHARNLLGGIPGAWPVQLRNDGTSACAAELTFGNAQKFTDFLYVFIGTLVGGGVVLNGSLYPGRSFYAGALGSLPLAGGRHLIHAASLYRLEERLAAAGFDPGRLSEPEGWTGIDAAVADWTAEAADGLATAVASAMCVIDFQGVVIDGGLPPRMRAGLVAAVRERLPALRADGVAPYAVVEGSIGAEARVIGAASLQLLDRYHQDRDVLFAPQRAPAP